MNFRQLNNEKGITLVELLASIGLLAIVIALSSTVFSQMFSAEEKADADIKTTQTLNVIVAEMKTDFIKGETEICANNLPGDITISIDSKDDRTEIIENCVTVDQEQNTLPIVIKATSDQGGSTEIKTTWNKLKPNSIEIAKGDDGGTDGVENDEEDYKPADGACKYFTDTKFIEHKWENFYETWPCPNGLIVHNGSAWFPAGVKIFSGIPIKIDHSFFSDKHFTIYHNSKAEINKSAKIEGNLSVMGSGVLDVEEHLIAVKKTTLQESSKTYIGKDGEFFNDLYMTGNAKFEVGGSLKVHKLVNLQEYNTLTINNNGDFLNLHMTGNAKIKVGGSLKINELVNLQEYNTLTINNNGDFLNKVHMMGKAVLNIKGNANFKNGLHIQDNSKIIVEGNATFKGPITPENGVGSICVKGDADINEVPDSDLKTIENALTCRK